MAYLGWQQLKVDPHTRIAAAIAAYTAREGHAPALVLVAAGEGAAVPGVEVREAKTGECFVRPGIVLVGGNDV